MNVRKHMSSPPIAVSGDTDFKTALALMEKHRIRRLPVIGLDGVIAGIVVERDLLIAADRYLNSPVDVARIMTRPVVTVRLATPVIDAAMLMTERKIGGLPVVDSSDKLLGIITETDLLHALVALLRRSQPRPPAATQSRRGKRPAKTPARKKRASKRPAATEPGTKSKRVAASEQRKRPPSARKSMKGARNR